MPKLATPIQYAPALEGLNDIRPLQLADEGKIVIPYPVLCKNPPSRGKPAVGKFARCSQQGALLKSVPVWADKYEGNNGGLSAAAPLASYTFAQKVFGFLIRATYAFGVSGCWWCNSSGSRDYTPLEDGVWTFLPFVGETIYARGAGTLAWSISLIWFGYYKQEIVNDCC